MTAESNVNREALGIVLARQAGGDAPAAIAGKVGELAALDDRVPTRALELAAAGERASLARETEAVIQPLFGEVALRDEVQKRIREDTKLTEAQRERALRLSETYPEDPWTLLNLSWRMVSDTGPQSAALYPQAVRMAEEACKLAPDDGMALIVLGAAQYRVGKDREALETLGRAVRFPGWISRRGEPPSIGFLGYQFRLLTKNQENAISLAVQVLVHARAGQVRECRAALLKLRELIKVVEVPGGTAGVSILSEAEAAGSKLK